MKNVIKAKKNYRAKSFKGLFVAFMSAMVLLFGSNAHAAAALQNIAWTDSQVQNLLTTPASTTIDGVPVTISTQLSGGAPVGTHIDSYSGYGYVFDGQPIVYPRMADMQLDNGRTLTVTTDITPDTLSSLELVVTDAEQNSFQVYAEDASGNRLQVTNWTVMSQELDGTTPASAPNPYTQTSTELNFAAQPGQNNDTMRIKLDQATLTNAKKLVFSFTSTNPSDWVEWFLRGSRLDHPPVANNDTGYTTNAGQPVIIPALANDTDQDGQSLSIMSVDGQSIGPGQTISLQSGQGTVRLEANGNLTYTPASGFSGPFSFSYTISDGSQQANATVSGSIAAPPVAPSPSLPSAPNTGVGQSIIVTYGVALFVLGVTSVTSLVALSLLRTRRN